MYPSDLFVIISPGGFFYEETSYGVTRYTNNLIRAMRFKTREEANNHTYGTSEVIRLDNAIMSYHNSSVFVGGNGIKGITWTCVLR